MNRSRSRRRMRAIWVVIALVALAFSGCAGNDPVQPIGVRADMAALQWPTMDVITTATEPNEARGLIRIGWWATLFAIESESEQDLTHFTIVDGSDVYTSYTGLGWISRDLAHDLKVGTLSNRLALWDLRELTRDSSFEFVAIPGPEGSTIYNATGTSKRGGLELEVQIEVRAVGAQVVAAELSAAEGRESPFHFQAAQGSLAFGIQVPVEVKAQSEVSALDALANQAEVQVLKLVQEYAATRQGLLPDSIDPDTLQVELLRSGKSWPSNPYTNAPLAAGAGHGEIRWTKCGPVDGRFQAFGWDSPLFGYSFGKSCRS